MDKEIIEKYKAEMLKMHRAASREYESKAISTVAEPSETPTAKQENSGKLFAVVTALRSIYPVPNAKVTVFTGDYDNMNVIDSALTDQSGRTRAFNLPTPEKVLSLESGNTVIPYAVYNMLVEADGYVDNLHINIPVFSGVTSIQGSNLMLRETAGANMEQQIFDESQKYDL